MFKNIFAWNRKTASCPHFHTMKYMHFFHNIQSSCPSVHTFSIYYKGYKKENMKLKDSFLSTYPHFWIMKYIIFVIKIIRIFRACPPFHTFCKTFWRVQEREKTWIEAQLRVHTFCKKITRLKKERKHEIEKPILVHTPTFFNKIKSLKLKS